VSIFEVSRAFSEVKWPLDTYGKAANQSKEMINPNLAIFLASGRYFFSVAKALILFLSIFLFSKKLINMNIHLSNNLKL
jgi:hypothetical protein